MKKIYISIIIIIILLKYYIYYYDDGVNKLRNINKINYQCNLIKY